LLYDLEGRSLGRLERAMARRFDLCLTTTPFEDATLQALVRTAPGRAVASGVVRNGVDLDFFHRAATPYDADRICFLGRMDYFPNEQAMVRFCADVLPRLQAERPNLRLTIVGADPGPGVRALADLPGVEVTGRVQDVRPYVWRCAATVAPLLIARGTQNKILESMAMGVPVVASELAARGVQAVPGVHLLTGGTPDQTAEAVLSLLRDPKTRMQVSASARQLVASEYSWSSTLTEFDTRLAALL
jgi:sugar transferase (PEP-CTERM/EpsH1 system associated)